MGTILLIAGIAILALLAVEFGLRARAKRRMEEGVFDHGLPLILGQCPGDDVVAGDERHDHRSLDHHAHGPMDHPGD